ncbi:serine--tRNA ligase [Candidatus Woesebacteria bacterium]|jgi:seryl-tRNA synthetase|nr:serine--tRNA ligase [Candidatus Woesebacteria bacterium]
MLDIKYIRENLELCKLAAVNKNRVVDWDELLRLDDARRELITKSDALRTERNEVSKVRSDDSNTRGKAIKVELKEIEDSLREVEGQFNAAMLTVPNVPDPSVPVGKDESGNVEVKKWGEPVAFEFAAKDHIELSRSLDLIDFDRGAKVGGSRAYFLKNEGAMLELAVLMYTFQKLVAKGYTPLIAPSLTKEFTFFGVGHFPWSRDEVYHLPKDDVYISGTAEVPVTAYYSDEVLLEKDLPKKFVAFSPCFRREAGSYGKDTRGVYRIHQFNKIEQVIIAPSETNNSLTLHEELLANSEEVLQDLKLPYRVLLMCTGDMGEPQVKKYDIETWMPGRGGYGETMSDSFMGDFQARRLKIRYKAKDGSTKFCHTLNNTAIASPRILVAIMENYQQADGSIRVPDVLVPFVGKKEIRR